MALHTFPLTGQDIGALHIEPVETEGRSARFDLALDMVEFQGELRATYEYASDLFDEATIARMHDGFVTLLEGIVEDPTRSLEELPLLSAPDETRLLDEWNATQAEHDRKAQQDAEHPEQHAGARACERDAEDQQRRES